MTRSRQAFGRRGPHGEHRQVASPAPRDGDGGQRAHPRVRGADPRATVPGSEERCHTADECVATDKLVEAVAGARRRSCTAWSASRSAVGPPTRSEPMNTLVFNCGSSSLKYRLLAMPEEREITGGEAQRIGPPTAEPARIVFRADGRQETLQVAMPDHAAASARSWTCSDAKASGALRPWASPGQRWAAPPSAVGGRHCRDEATRRRP